MTQKLLRSLQCQAVFAGLTLLTFNSATAQIGGTLELQTNCEHALAGMKIEGDKMLLPLGGGDAYQCFGFINAIQQLSAVTVEGRTLTNLCLPEKSTLAQLVRVVVAYGQRHPEKLSEGNAAIFVINALADAFPCR